MITLFRSNKTHTLKDLPQTVIDYLPTIQKSIDPIGNPHSILRFEWNCEPVDILDWLGNQNFNTQVFWSSRKEDYTTAGIGIADKLSSSDILDYEKLTQDVQERIFSDNPHLKYYGGIRFHTQKCDDSWTIFGMYQFVVPRFELFRDEDRYGLALNILTQDITPENLQNLKQDLQKLNPILSHKTSLLPQNPKREDCPNLNEWKSIFKSAMAKIANKELDKIVLARKSSFVFSESIDAVALLSKIKANTPHCFHFLFQPNKKTAFLGASPELLYHRQDHNIQTEAIAGTKPRGINPENDFRLEDELLHSPKNAREHQFVVEDIQSILNEICENFECDQKFSLLKLNGAHHLITRFNGRLKSHIHDAEILKSLHPTPAVGGSPTNEALKEIENIEPFDRGWYTGPVGCIGHNSSEFCVAIRSALLQDKTLSLFAGAGIVAGSVAEDEWNEIENKIATFSQYIT